MKNECSEELIKEKKWIYAQFFSYTYIMEENVANVVILNQGSKGRKKNKYVYK